MSNNDNNDFDEFDPDDMKFTAAEMSILALAIAFVALSIHVWVRVAS